MVAGRVRLPAQARSARTVQVDTNKENTINMATTTIRDLREQKNLSQDKVAEAAGLTYSKFVRIEEGSGKTTQDEIAAVLAVLEKMEPGTRKLAGRPFKDAAKQAAVLEARAQGKSVAAVMYGSTTPAPAATPAPAKKAAASKKAAAGTDLAGALAGKAPRKRASKKAATPAAS